MNESEIRERLEKEVIAFFNKISIKAKKNNTKDLSPFDERVTFEIGHDIILSNSDLGTLQKIAQNYNAFYLLTFFKTTEVIFTFYPH